MNKAQRKILTEAIEAVSPFADADHVKEEGVTDTLSAIEAFKGVLETLAEEEREKFDNLSEGLQGSERGQAMETAADAFDSAVSTLEGIVLDPKKLEEDWEENVSDEIQTALDEAEAYE